MKDGQKLVAGLATENLLILKWFVMPDGGGETLIDLARRELARRKVREKRLTKRQKGELSEWFFSGEAGDGTSTWFEEFFDAVGIAAA